MKNADGYIVGWVDTSIGNVVESDPDALSQFTHVLVTCVDSSVDVPGMKVVREIVRDNSGYRVVVGGLLIPGAALAQVAVSYGLFTGFDELWCFDKEPTVAKPGGVRIVAPLRLDSESVDTAVLNWMRQSGCSLGLGDGVGLNYVTPHRALAARIEQANPPE